MVGRSANRKNKIALVANESQVFRNVCDSLDVLEVLEILELLD